jgi:hypothetical protein
MGRTTRLGPADGGVLVVIRAPRSRPRGERRGLGEGIAGAAGVRVRGGARQTGDGRARSVVAGVGGRAAPDVRALVILKTNRTQNLSLPVMYLRFNCNKLSK